MREMSLVMLGLSIIELRCDINVLRDRLYWKMAYGVVSLILIRIVGEPAHDEI